MAFLPPHHTVTYDSLGMLLFYINYEIDLSGWMMPSPAPTNPFLGAGDATTRL